MPVPVRSLAELREVVDPDIALAELLGTEFWHSPYPMTLVSRDLRILRSNDAFAEMVGRSVKELAGMAVNELTHPEDVLPGERAAAAVLRSAAPTWLEKRYLRPDGECVWARLHLSVLRSPSGRTDCLLVQAIQVTQEQQLKQRLLALSQLRKALAETNEAMLRASNPEGLAKLVCQLAVEHGGLRMAWVGVVDGQGWLRPVASFGATQRYFQGLRISVRPDVPEGQGPVGAAARDGVPAVFQDVKQDERFRPWVRRAGAAGFRSVAALPLPGAIGQQAVLAVYASQPNFFDDEALELLERLAANLDFAWTSLTHRDKERRARIELERSQRTLLDLFDNTGVISALLDSDLTVVRVNPAMCRLLGSSPGQLVGRRLTDLLHAGDHEHLRKALARPKSGARHQSQLVRIYRRDGSEAWLAMSVNRIPSETEAQFRLIWQAQDVTPLQEAEQALQRRSAQQAAVAELGQQALRSPDLDDLLQSAVEVVALQLDLTAAAAYSWNADTETLVQCAGVGYPPGADTTLAADNRSQSGYTLCQGEAVVCNDTEAETRFQTSPLAQSMGMRSGVTVVIQGHDGPWGILGAVSATPHAFSSEDVSFLQGVSSILASALVRQRMEEQLQVQALHDPLTNLPNRTLLMDRIEMALNRMRRSRRPVTLMFVDLDRFKVINDSLGHSTGDLVLQRVAERLSASVRPNDTVARFGGDEFVILSEDARSEATAMKIAERLVRSVERPIDAGGDEVVVSSSIGVAVTNDPGASGDDLLRDADIAMYHAKSGGGRSALRFTASMREVFSDRLRLESELRRAFEQRNLTLLYQPCVDLRSGRIVGAEALIRWEHPTRGLILPADFIPLAEESGAILEIGNWVLNEACQQAARWTALRPAENLEISVNLSTRQLHDPECAKRVQRALSRAKIQPQQLCLEITETAVLADSASSVVSLQQLSRLGINIALDDFGTGYSSVSHLKRFPLSQLKIDKGFVGSVDSDPRDVAIVAGLIKLAHEVGVTVVAEGVERPEQLKLLKRLHCDRGQGFLMAPPVTAEEFGGLWLEGARLTCPAPAAKAGSPAAPAAAAR